MTEIEEQMKAKEREIPVLTVLKNNCILKNIFLLDKPPSISSSVAEDVDRESEIEEILVVGRHPDCNIKLEHPSISRFHLRIHSKPSSRSLFVTDLSSVHGTWVSGKRIEPLVRVKLNEGDMLHLGASSRMYRLNWVPLTRAYEIDDPFVLQLDAPNTVDGETDVVTDNVEGLLSDEDIGFTLQKMSPIAPKMPQDFFSNEDEIEDIGLPEIYNKENELSSSQLGQFDTSVTVDEETEGTTDQDGVSSHSGNDGMEGLEQLFSDEGLVMKAMPESLYESPEVCNKENSTPEAEIEEYSGMNSDQRSVMNIWSRRGKPKSVKVETSKSRGNCTRINTSLNELKQKDQFESSDNTDETETGICTPDKENTSPDSNLVRSLKSKFEETLKVESIPNTLISSVDQGGEIFTPDKENMTPPSHLFKSMKSIGKSGEVKHPKSSSVDQEEEIFTPDKENMTPPSHLFKSMKNIGKSGEVKHPKSYRPSPLKIANNSNMYQDSKSAFPVSKIHGGLKTKQSVPKARPDREPFCPLLVTSDHKAKSHTTNTMKADEKRWTIIADTTTLLNKKSRKELQLLRGLRGTTLVIPRIVVRELDCMIKRASFFSRMTEASAALNWIEECMAATERWIHVQNSAEEGKLIPPTPPAASSSPRWFSEDKSVFSVGSIPFSPYGLQEIVTPTATDHILECALLFRRTIDGQLVLLSDDVGLKIKAMAEGVVCERAEEFRRSVVNPFSPRSLYSNSSPIGPTWSCSDDLVLKENYYPSPSKKSGDCAKGLKLILLHNSSFRQITN